VPTPYSSGITAGRPDLTRVDPTHPDFLYQEHVDGRDLDVLWLEAEQLPALVRQKSPQREEVLRLRELYPLQHAPWPRANIAHYRRIDYADLGDMHHDPWVRRMQQGEQRMSRHGHPP
jgi:hypothetical protein